MPGRRLEDAVGIGQGVGHRLLDYAVDAALGGHYQRLVVVRVGRADADDVDTAAVEHGSDRAVVVLDLPAPGELLGSIRRDVAA